MKTIHRYMISESWAYQTMLLLGSRKCLMILSAVFIFSSSLLLYSLMANEDSWLNLTGNKLQTNGYIIISDVQAEVKETPRSQRKHVVIFDGGSTGTRIHVFTFQIKAFRETEQTKNKRKRIILKSEDFKSITPGLSSYAQVPIEAAHSIRSLLDFAAEIVPLEHRSNTSLYLIATAGLRLLPDSESSAILDSVENMLHAMDPPYRLHEDSIKILDGNSEGIFGWVTINFLLKKIHGLRKSAAVLDLGGGSTQITFAPLPEGMDKWPSRFLIKQDILGKQVTLYTHSYLGYGLMAARQAILTRTLGKAHTLGTNRHLNISHPCFKKSVQRDWSYQYVTYSITGTEGDCFHFIDDYFIERGDIQKATELNEREIYGISYYYDRMADMGIINRTDYIGTVYVRDYYLAAKKVCGSSFDLDHTSKRFKGQRRMEREMDALSFSQGSEFLCLDLTYITHLLSTGYGLRWDKSITLGKRINNVELSWALGAAFSQLDVS